MAWKGVSPKPDFETVCRPEFGLTMVLGLVGAGGIGQVLFASIRGF